MAGYVDLQVNGYGGVDFNADELTEQQLAGACERVRSDGTRGFYATVITAPLEKMVSRIARLAQIRRDVPEVASTMIGIHVEGPFLNPADGFIGAHPADAASTARKDAAQRLLEAGEGLVKLFTLAPEMDASGRVTRWLTDAGVVVAAGHSDATLDQLRCGIDQGLRLFTHLGNGCPALLPRHDNIVQRVLSLSDRLMVSFIADGHHVPGFALSNYIDRVPDDHVVVVTDAISAAGLGPGRYTLSGQVVYVDQDRAAWAECRTHFAGCATTLPQMAAILSDRLGVSDDRIDLWMDKNPSRLMGFSTT